MKKKKLVISFFIFISSCVIQRMFCETLRDPIVVMTVVKLNCCVVGCLIHFIILFQKYSVVMLNCLSICSGGYVCTRFHRSSAKFRITV